MRCTTGSKAAVARGVNARLTSRRKRVWSGGSTTSIDGGSATPVGVELVTEAERPADQPRCGGPVPPDAEAVGAEDLRGDRVRGGDQPEAAADQRAARPQLLVHRVGLVADGRVAEQPPDRVAAAGARGRGTTAGEAVPDAPADDGAGRTQGGGRDPFRRPPARRSSVTAAGVVVSTGAVWRSAAVVGAGASLGSPFQSLPAVSAFSEALSVCAATVSTISSSETPSPAASVWLVGSLIGSPSLSSGGVKEPLPDRAGRQTPAPRRGRAVRR